MPLTFGVNQSPDSLIALAAAANKGGVSSTNPVAPKSRINIMIPELKEVLLRVSLNYPKSRFSVMSKKNPLANISVAAYQNGIFH